MGGSSTIIIIVIIAVVLVVAIVSGILKKKKSGSVKEERQRQVKLEIKKYLKEHNEIKNRVVEFEKVASRTGKDYKYADVFDVIVGLYDSRSGSLKSRHAFEVEGKSRQISKKEFETFWVVNAELDLKNTSERIKLGEDKDTFLKSITSKFKHKKGKEEDETLAPVVIESDKMKNSKLSPIENVKTIENKSKAVKSTITSHPTNKKSKIKSEKSENISLVQKQKVIQVESKADHLNNSQNAKGVTKDNSKKPNIINKIFKNKQPETPQEIKKISENKEITEAKKKKTVNKFTGLKS